jgi:hypothetical protein
MNKKNLMENDEAEAEPVNRSGGAAAGLWKRDDSGLVVDHLHIGWKSCWGQTLLWEEH